jgi:hypothetical protein
MMATVTDASVKIAPMMLRTMVMEAVLSGEAELVGAAAAGFTLVAVAITRFVERDMILRWSQSHWKVIRYVKRD